MARTTTPRSAAFAVGLGVAVLGTATPTWAAASAAAQSVAQPVGSASWGIVPTFAGTAPAAPSALVLTFPTQSNAIAPPMYFNAINNRTAPLIQATYTLSQSVTTRVRVEACSTTWNEAAGTCSGTITLLVITANGTTAGSALSTIVPAGPGAVLRLRARPTQASTNAYTVTIGIEVARTGGVRAATTTDS